MDSSEPEIIIEKPIPGEDFGSGEQVLFEGTVTDDVGVILFEIQPPDEQWLDITNVLTSDSWKYVWDTTDVEVGKHTIRFRARDEVAA